MGLQSVLLGLFSEFFSVLRDFIKSLSVGSEDNGSDQTGTSINGNRNISVLEPKEKISLRTRGKYLLSDDVTVPLAVDFRNIDTSQRSSLNEEIVETDLSLGTFVQNSSDPIYLVNIFILLIKKYLMASSIVISVSK